jgi:penicillin-binding protein 2
MSANSYNRYVSFTIAYDVSDDTVAAVLENSGELSGVTVEQQYVRRYVNSVYCSQVLGYTGTISTTELETLNAEKEIYENNDVVGKTGIEQSMESELAGTKGSKTVYVDTVGRITEVVDETEAVAGNDVYLTIDINLQKEIYEEIEDQIVAILLDYITLGDEKYEYDTSGDISQINITIKEVYVALIDNNLVDLDKMALCQNEAETEVYNTYLEKKAQVFSWLETELKYSDTKYGDLTEEQQAYIWYIYKDLLCTNKVFNTSKVDTNDSVYKNWANENDTSLTELLKYGITKNWVDMSLLADQQYTSLSESYDILYQYIIDQLSVDDDFSKKMYKYMVENVDITGQQLIMILFEQGYLHSDTDEYTLIKEGRLSPYNFMLECISTKRITPAELALEPCSGSCVMTDPNTGKVLALVSYPSYDNNKMSGTVDAEYYAKLSNDKSKPLTNYATQAQNAPGSTFKICSAIASMDLGVIDSSTEFYCTGTFSEITPVARCWQRWGHGTEGVSTAIRDSCNVYFYNVGYRLGQLKDGTYNSTYGLNILKNYAEQMGLATKSGIEISERSPQASTEDAVRSAIGQGTHLYSTLNLARYVTTIANSGTCYNLTLIDKITDNSGNLIRENEAEVANTMNISSNIWNTVHYGMYLATESYSAINSLGVTIGSKTGTAQESTKDPDHATMISYAPYEDPQVAMAVIIRNGYGSGYTATLTANILKTYFGLE